ncbi:MULTISPECIES: LacI family DNA-binding transcriptional regulator [unclassified Paenibacillus]|uniref:LacI family DNA-binding transcriptional regulator n=1 Tax=unclassified Paenibacillus TaxID=185978 RepID=UPI002404F9F4|nr:MULTISPECIES: LacI family DNA-binding transcriptional regulator [unclassified Paenibacillus]
MTVTMKKVAHRAGVSVSTVSRVLAGYANVREETSRKVRQTMEELGYTPNIIAQNLVSRTTRCICVLLPDTAEIWPANLYVMEVIRGIVSGAGRLGYDIQLASGNGEREQLEAVSRLLKGGRADGAILLSARRSSAVVGFLQQEGYPFVLVEDGPDAGSEEAGREESCREGADGRSSSLAIVGTGPSEGGGRVSGGESVSVAEADLHERVAGKAGHTKAGWESAGGESNSKVGDAGSMSEAVADQQTAEEGASQARFGRECAGEANNQLQAAAFPGMPDESVARMGALASELLIGSIRQHHQQQSPGGNAGWMAQFVLRRPILRR